MKRVTFILALSFVGFVLTACVPGAPGQSSAVPPGKGSSAAPPLPTLREEVEYLAGRVWTRHTYYLDGAGRHVKHGLEKGYQRDGQVIYQAEYKDGVLDGEELHFHPMNGALARHGRWDRGKETGLWQGWQQTGELYWKATYRDGKIIGERRWYVDAKLRCEDTYDDNGKLAKKVALYPIAVGGERVREYEGNYLHGVMHGTWTCWYSDGRVKATGEWKDGKPWNGVCGTPIAGDAGSWGGILTYHEYKDGKDLGEAVLPPRPKPPPKGE